MSTLSLRLRYRPLKIGWCVKAGDLTAIRRAVRLTTTMWGGRFNPIIPCDDVDHAKRLIDLYRVDVLFAPSPDVAIQAFIDSQKHLPDPFYAEHLFAPRGDGRKSAQVVDLTHPIMKTSPSSFAIISTGKPWPTMLN